jgi:hypothetical protein
MELRFGVEPNSPHYRYGTSTSMLTKGKFGAPAGNLTRVSSLLKMRSVTELQGLEPHDRLERSSPRYECGVASVVWKTRFGRPGLEDPGCPLSYVPRPRELL